MYKKRGNIYTLHKRYLKGDDFMDGDVILKEIINANETETYKLNESVNNFIQTFIDAIKDESVQSFYADIKRISNKYEAISNLLGIEDNIEKEKVYYFAMMQTISIIAEKLSGIVENYIEDFSNYKYIYDILGVLMHNGATPQGNLSERLNIDHHILANTMRRTKKYNLWISQKHGREVYYHISNKGEKSYIHYLNKNISNKPKSLEKFLNISLEAISNQMNNNEPDINKIIRDINTSMEYTVIKSKYTKVKLQEIFLVRDKYLKNEYIKAYKTESRYKDTFISSNYGKTRNSCYYIDDFNDIIDYYPENLIMVSNETM